jgi:ABC-2 type transport system permease protein
MTAALLGAEFRRTLHLARTYWLEYIADFVLYFAGFLLLIVVFNAASPNFGSQGILSSLIGYITWKVCASSFQNVANIADEEARTGTLEQIFLSGSSALQVFLARSLGIFLNQALRGLLLGLILGAVLGALTAPTFLALAIFLLTFLGALGLGLGMAGLILVYKRMGGFLTLIWQMLVFFSGALAPLPGALLGWLSSLLPLSWGIAALRASMVNGEAASDLWRSGLLPGLLLNTAAYLTLGVFLFIWGERRARRLGVLGHY